VTRRLLLSYVGLALLILIVLEVPFGLLEARHEREVLTDQTQQEATSLALAVGEDLHHGNRHALGVLIDGYRAQTGGSVTVFDAAGHVVAATGTPLVRARSDRAEVRVALAGGSARALVRTGRGRTAIAAVAVGPVGDTAGAVLLVAPARVYGDRTRDVWTALGVFAALVLALTVVVGLALARSLTRPVSRLQAAVAALGEGHLESRAELGRGPPELVALGRQFNRMADRLQLLVDAQVQFVADASHQLRSPLTALRLRLENLEVDLDGQAADGLAAAGREVQRLSRLVDGLLTLGRADGPAEGRAVSVGAVVTERCEAWAALAAERRVDLERRGQTAAPVVTLVPGDLDQILDNLVANALEVSPPASRIVVELRRDPAGGTALHIVDEGPGLDEVDRARAFDRFWQGPGRRGGHSGLGLAIVRQLARRNGIDVRLDAAPGGGLDAVVLLTATATADRRAAVPQPA
jgi:signal transduction histidine kinase